MYGGRASVAGQLDRHHGAAGGQETIQSAPHRSGLGKAVGQDEARAVTLLVDVECGRLTGSAGVRCGHRR